AGFETTTHLLGNMVRQLVAHPEQLARVRADRSLIGSTVEEVLRFDPPVQLDGRYVFEDIELDGAVIEKGATVITLLAAANRDPAVCADPDTFDVARADHQILSFGSGIHYCLGAALARLEGQVVLERLLARYGDWAITAEPVWRPRITIRGVERLEVRFA
ncbi:MAG: cytochrome P450, partial [Acidimicrobiales bacterium]